MREGKDSKIVHNFDIPMDNANHNTVITIEWIMLDAVRRCDDSPRWLLFGCDLPIQPEKLK